MNAEGMLKEDNVVQTTQENFQLPPSDHQEDTKGHESHDQMLDRPCDMVYGAIPTSLPPLETSRRRIPKCIHIDESLIGSLEGTLSKHSIAYQAQQILVNYFDSKCDGDKCRLFISLLKSRSMTVVRKNLRIKMINSSEPSSYVVRSLVDAFSNIGKKSRSKDRNAAHRVLSQSIVNKSTMALHLLKPTYKLVGLDIKALRRYCSRREELDFGQTSIWAFIGRSPCSDMKLINAVKGLVQDFWSDNIRTWPRIVNRIYP